MINPDYSKDAPLLEWEEIDYDTKYGNPTGINTTRMRLPNRYDISKFYKRNKRNTERGKWVKKDPDDILDFSSDFSWQITYSFPNSLRNPVTDNGYVYGGKAVTFRRLYLILAERFKNYFIDDYFDTVYPFSSIKKEVDSRLETVKYELIGLAEDMLSGYVENGRFKRGGRIRLKEYESFAREWEDKEGEYLASLIKEDIIDSLLSGRLVINHVNTTQTDSKRVKAGLSADPVFLATGQLIESLQLFLTLRSDRKWQTKLGIMV